MLAYHLSLVFASESLSSKQLNMSDAATATATASVPTTPKKAKGKATAASKKPRVKPTHPKTSDMVTTAIKNLKERGGSSLQAIKKYISANYKVDAEKMAPFIRKYLKSAVTTGSLVQTKGKGASGSFKLSGAPGEKKVATKTAKPKAPKAKKTKPATAKPVAEKKSAASTPKKAPAKPKAAKPAPSKAKKTTKTPTKKPKAPKPKKVGVSKSPKKAAPKKK